MPPLKCSVIWCKNKPVLKRPKTGDTMCKECFFYCFEEEIHYTITSAKLFKKGDKVAIGASGGKDSTVLAHTMKVLNERYNYGLDLFLLSIDEGITGYRDDSLETVKQNRDDYQLPLKILSYKDLYGWTMDEIVAQIGKKNNCTFCGVFRRQALDRGAALIGANMIATGHNADDMAETVLLNVLRGDSARLSRCTNIITEGEGTIPRCKPLKFCYEKEIVLYAHYKKLVYFSTECTYAPNAYRGHAREFIKDAERIRPSCIFDIIHAAEIMEFKDTVKFPTRKYCTRCGFVASQEICKACVLLEGLNTGNPRLGVTKSNKARRAMGLKVEDGSENKGKRRKEDRDPNYLSKRKMKRELRKERRGQSTCEDECSTTCQSEPEVKKESVKVSAEELIPEGTSEDLSDLILPLALYSSDEEEDGTEDTKKEKPSKEEPSKENQQKSSCGEGCESSCSSKNSRPSAPRKSCGQGGGCKRDPEPNIFVFKQGQGCGEDDHLVSLNESGDEEPETTKENKGRTSSLLSMLKGDIEVIIESDDSSEEEDVVTPTDEESSSDDEVIDVLERLRQQKNNDVECNCPECQGDDEIGGGFINIKLLKQILEIDEIPESERFRIFMNGNLIDVDAIHNDKSKIVGESEGATTDAASNKPGSSSTKDTEKQKPVASSSANSKPVTDGPDVVIANPVRKGPSLLLPEMMHKTTNKLDF